MHVCALGCSAALLLATTLSAHAWDHQHRSCFPPPKGISSWWPGDGNGADIVSGRTATFVGDATTRPGLVGKAFTLDGDGDFMEVPPEPGLDFGRKDFTVVLWVKFGSLAGEQVIIEKWVQKFDSPSLGWTLTKLEDNRIRLALGAQDSSSEINVDSAEIGLAPNVWMQVAARRYHNHFTLFLNGRQIAAGSVDPASPFSLRSASSLKFGHRCSPADTPGCQDSSGFFLDGQIDEVQLFGRALPIGLIRAIYLAGSRGECKSLKDRDDDEDGDDCEDESHHPR